MAMMVEQEDVACAAELKAGKPATRETVDTPDGKKLSSRGLRNFWRGYNLKSLDGLPGLSSAYEQEELVGTYATTGEVFSAMSQKEPEEEGQLLAQVNAVEGEKKTAVAVGTGKERNIVDFGLTLGAGFILGALFMRFSK